MKCIIVDDDEMSRIAVKHFVERTNSLQLLHVCADAIEAANVVRSEKVELVFLDIELPEMSGLEFIKSIDSNFYYILITSKKDYAIDAFEYNVVDYLLKPITYPRFLKAVEKAQKMHETHLALSHPVNLQPDNKNIFVKTQGRLIRIHTDDILWVEALADYVIIHTITGKFTIHTTMRSMESTLPQNEFMRVHRSYIVRVNRISEIEENTLVVNRQLIPIGKSYRNDLMKQLKMI